MKKKILVALFSVLGFLILAIVISLRTHCTVSIERSFNASPQRVWMHWNDIHSIKNWWGPKDYTAPIVKNDLRVDGLFFLSMKAPDGKMHYNVGKYKEIVAYQKIVSSLSFADENGNAVPGDKVELPGKWPDEVTITVVFREHRGRTFIKVTEEGIPSIMYFFAKLGWNQQFDKFEAMLK